MPDTFPSRNETWGFFGTMVMAGADPMLAWSAASVIIAAETDGPARGGLAIFWIAGTADTSPMMSSARSQVEAAWRRRSRPQSPAGMAGGSAAAPPRHEGIPAGLPYLTGFVSHFAILDAMAPDAAFSSPLLLGAPNWGSGW